MASSPTSRKNVGAVVPNRFGPDTRFDFHVLKDGDLFVVFPSSGEINARDAGPGEARARDGLFYRDTRYLSRLAVSLNGASLIELGHDARTDTPGFRSDLANGRLIDSAGREFLDHEIHVARDRFLSDGLYDSLTVTNYGRETTELDLVLECWADFRDIFEVRGAVPADRGELQPPVYAEGEIRFSYLSTDGRRLTTEITIRPAPSVEGGRAHVALSVPPGASRSVSCRIRVGTDTTHPGTGMGADGLGARHGGAQLDTPVPESAVARKRLQARLGRQIARTARIATSRPAFDAWLERSSADLAMLTAELPTGPYPHAGVPWFSVPFGRDALVTALQTLWLDPELAGGVLDFLAATQARTHDAFSDAEPGKILHEHRDGEMSRTGAVPFRHYYGGIDQTLLFVMLAHAHWRRTADTARLQHLAPAIRAALDWAERYGDRDGDGFIEYARTSELGLRNQGWKDSDDAIFYEDGTLCASPISLVEVQGYHVAALNAAADMLAALGEAGAATSLRQKVALLVESIDAHFWDDDLQTFCIALDAENRRVRVSSSNAGHLLYCGAVLPHRVAPLVETLSAPPLLCGWGLRTVAEGAARFNPMGYHNGTVWPHDNSLIAAGAARSGQQALACRITEELFDASCQIAEHRLPELWCGFARTETARPVAFPSACAPQAWAAGAPFLCLQGCLGVDIDAVDRRVSVRQPVLPAGIRHLDLRGIPIGGHRLSLRFETGPDARVHVVPIEVADTVEVVVEDR